MAANDSIDFFIKQGDTYPFLDATLKDSNDTVINITDGTVKFNMWNEGHTSTVVALGAGSVMDGTGGSVRYAWGTADTTTAGIFDAEFQVNLSTGKIVTCPNDGYIRISITSQIA